MSARRVAVRTLALITPVALLASLLVALTPLAPAAAANGNDFDAGNIISDSVFFNPTTMSASQIQQFLSSQGAGCVAGQQPCLKDYRTVTVSKPAETGLCSGYAGGLNQSAAEIIAGVAQSCGINPRVLIVLLEKENSLVTRTRPTTSSYQTAAGYGCPDTSICDAQYFGFFNQLYMAARQYQNYAANPTRFGYSAGRFNTVYWNPNTACGTSQVFIVDQATAGLYNYTPYRPNAAALNNLYGTGDSCSSYGNRNFWRLFTDWFGSTQQNTFLMRSAEDATVYIVSGNNKYPIASSSTLQALSPLGAVGYVSQQYLDRRTTGPVVQRSILGPDGTVYFFDAGILLPFASCAQVADFGLDCGSAVSLGAALIAAFHPGPRMTNLYRTTSGKTFYVQGGKRREVADDASLVSAGLPTSGVTLLESGIGYLSYGVPIARSGILLRDRSTNSLTLSTSGSFTPVSPDIAQLPGISTLPVDPLDHASLQQLTLSTALSPLVRGTSDPQAYLLTKTGKSPVKDPGALPTTVVQVADSALALIPTVGDATYPIFVKATNDGTVYFLRAGQTRALRSWTDLLALNGNSTSVHISVIPGSAINTLPHGPVQVAPGSLIIAPGNGTVYLADGTDSRVTVGSFAVTGELGATRLSTISDSDLARYTLSPAMLNTAVSCGTDEYLGLSGRLVTVPPTMTSTYNLKPTTLDPATCAALPHSSQQLDRFLRTPDGTIYLMEAGLKRPILSFNSYTNAGGTTTNTIAITDFTASRFPTGAPY